MIIIVTMIRLLSGTKAIKNAKPRKQKIKDELMPIAWYPSRWWDWCVPEDKKKETVILWG